VSEEIEAAAPTAVPVTAKIAGAIASFQGGLAIVAGILFIVRWFMGVSEGYRGLQPFNTMWFFIIGGGVLAAGIALLRGKQWGRTIAMMAQLLLLPIAYDLFFVSHQQIFGVLVCLISVAGLIALFHPRTNEWMASSY
jgi:hypothetical protein